MYARVLKLVFKEITWVEKIKKGCLCCKGCCTKPPDKPPGSGNPPCQCTTLSSFQFLTWESPPSKHPLKKPLFSEYICSPPPNNVPQTWEPWSSEPLDSPSHSSLVNLEKINKGDPCCKGSCTMPPDKPPSLDYPPSECTTLSPVQFLTWESQPSKHPLKKPLSSEYICSPSPHNVSQIWEPWSSEPSSVTSSKSVAPFSEAPKSKSQPFESNEPTSSEHFIGPVEGVPPSSEELTSTPSPSKKSSFDNVIPIFPLSSNSPSGEMLPSTPPLPDRPQFSERVVSNCMPSQHQTTSDPYDAATSLSPYDTPTCDNERVVSNCMYTKHQTTSEPYNDATSLSPYDIPTCGSEHVVSNCMSSKHQTTSEPYDDKVTSLSSYDISTCDSNRIVSTNMPSKPYDAATPWSPYDNPYCEPYSSKQRMYDPANPSGELGVFDLPSSTPLSNALPVNKSLEYNFQATSDSLDSAQKADEILTPKIQTRSHTTFTAPPSFVPPPSAHQSIYPSFTFTSSKNSNLPYELSHNDLPNSEASNCGLQSQDRTTKEKKNNSTFPTQNPPSIA